MLKDGDLAVINTRANTKKLHGMIVQLKGTIPIYESSTVSFLFIDTKGSTEFKNGQIGGIELFKLSPFFSSNRGASPFVLKKD